MPIKIQHKFQSEIPDGNKEGVIKPSHWNDDHKITLSQDKIIGRASEGEGDAEEITCTAIARSLLEKTNAAGLRSVLELGSAALLDEATAANFAEASIGYTLSVSAQLDGAAKLISGWGGRAVRATVSIRTAFGSPDIKTTSASSTIGFGAAQVDIGYF